MAELVNMPKLGFDMQEGQLVNWVKAEGDSVQRGEIIAEIETDKATVEVESFRDGTLLDLLVEPGTYVPIGEPIAVIGEPGEEYDLAALGVGAEAEAEPEAVTKTPQVAAPAREREDGRGEGDGFPAGVRASPLARRVADEKGVDITRVPGTGPAGRVVRADVEAFSERPAAPPHPSIQVPTGPDTEEIPTPPMRKRIGARMVESKTTTPHFYVTVEIDMGPALELRKQINATLDDVDKVTVNDMIVKAVALTLRRFPNLNSSYAGDTIVRHNHVNVGIAVAVENGLLNVVSKDADITPITQMAPVHKELIGRAREGKVRPEDVEGETFAVSNLGAYDVDQFAAIINPPAAAIIAVGTAKQVPIVVEGEITVGVRMKATLSADHRVTDGAEAAEFTRHFKQLLEDPLRLMM